MGNKYLCTGAVVMAGLVFGASSAAAIERHVQINNRTSYDIIEFYASNVGTSDWEEDILGRDILPSGYSVVVNIDDGSGYCKYDFLAVFSDGEQLVSANRNVCELDQFDFTE